jgi:thymidylate synthase (FAD)
MDNIAEFYQEMISKNIPNEDARMILPNACFTSIIVSMNARSLMEQCSKRLCNRAQWEIRELYTRMVESIKDVYPHVWEKCFPNCTKKCGCLEAKPCGSPYEKFSSNK